MSYVPGSTCVTRLPAASRTMIVAPGPTDAKSFGFSPEALPGTTSAAAPAMISRAATARTAERIAGLYAQARRSDLPGRPEGVDSPRDAARTQRQDRPHPQRAALLPLLEEGARRGREARRRDRLRARQEADAGGRERARVLRDRGRRGRRPRQGPQGAVPGAGRLLRRDRADREDASHGDGREHLRHQPARDHGAVVPDAARPPAADRSEGAGGARRAPRARDDLALGAQLGAEALAE